MDLNTILLIVSSILGILSVLLGTKYAGAKGKLFEAGSLLKEALDVVDVSLKAVEDDKITKDEVALIKKEAQEVKAAWRNLRGK